MLPWTPILYDIAQTFESVADPETRIDRVLGLVGSYVPYDRCVLLEVSPVLARTITVIPTPASHGDAERLTHRAEALLARLIERSAHAHRTAAVQDAQGARPHLAVPIFSLGDVIALLLVEQQHSSYDETHLAFLSIVASEVGAYLSALKSHREVRMLTDNSPNVLGRFDRNLRHVFVNAAVESAMGVKRDAIIGRTIAEVGIPQDLAELWTQQISRVFDTGDPSSLEFSLTGPHGLRHYAARLVPERNATNEVHYVLAVTTDCTVQREAEAALRAADRQKDLFLATLAHELRNLLAPISSAAKVIELQVSDLPKLQPASQVIGRQVQHMSRLLDDLLDISRITHNTLELRKTPADLAGIVAMAVETSRPLIDARAHRLTVSSPEESIVVDADPTRLAQVFANLLTNAAKYTAPHGNLRVTLAQQGGEGRVSFADNGAGLTAEQLTKVFQLFVRGNQWPQSSQDGLGIGLALAEHLVKLHGGTIEAHSDGPGQGTEFVVRLPLSIDSRRGRESTPATAVDARRMRIADDNREWR